MTVQGKQACLSFKSKAPMSQVVIAGSAPLIPDIFLRKKYPLSWLGWAPIPGKRCSGSGSERRYPYAALAKCLPAVNIRARARSRQFQASHKPVPSQQQRYPFFFMKSGVKICTTPNAPIEALPRP